MKTENATRTLQLLWVLVVILCFFTSARSQSAGRIIQWPDPPINFANHISTTSQGFAEIENLEIIDISVGGKPITMGKAFPANDDWLKTIVFKVKNVSRNTIALLQINLFLPEIMTGGPQVSICYGCGDTKGRVIQAGEIVEVKTALYGWVEETIKSKTSLSKITKAEIHDILVRLPDGQMWMSGCMKTADAKNACPKEP